MLYLPWIPSIYSTRPPRMEGKPFLQMNRRCEQISLRAVAATLASARMRAVLTAVGRNLRTVSAGPVLTGAACLFGISSAVRLRWICDDAFISFRYALNATRGLGLVFNAGDRVEGYTNFLWTILVAGALRFGFSAEGFSQALGIVCYAGTLGTLGWLSYRLHMRFGTHKWWPAAAGAFALHFHARVFATGGLETALFTLLVVGGTTLVFEGRPLPQCLGFAVYGLSALTRPEGVVFYAGAAGVLLLLSLRHRSGLRDLVREHLPMHACFLGLWLPFILWRFSYYGDWLPNTYYAKSGGAAHYSQGLLYVGLYFSAYYVLLAAPAVFLLLRYTATRMPAQNRAGMMPTVGLVSLPALGLVFYYARVGGDFMFARFLIPITPLLLVLLELLLLRVVPPERRLLGYAFVLLATAGAWNPYHGRPLPQIYGISQEHEVYRPAVLARAAEVAASWREVFDIAGVRIAIGGAQAFLAYRTEAPFVLEGAGGLTDRWLAHRPVAERGRMMGHERRAPLAYLRERRIHLHMNALYLEPLPEYARVKFPLGTAAVICYEARVMKQLRRLPGFSIPPFEEFLDSYLRTINTRSQAQIRKDYTEFRAYYFRCTEDPARERQFIARIRE